MARLNDRLASIFYELLPHRDNFPSVRLSGREAWHRTSELHKKAISNLYFSDLDRKFRADKVFEGTGALETRWVYVPIANRGRAKTWADLQLAGQESALRYFDLVCDRAGMEVLEFPRVQKWAPQERDISPRAVWQVILLSLDPNPLLENQFTDEDEDSGLVTCCVNPFEATMQAIKLLRNSEEDAPNTSGIKWNRKRGRLELDGEIVRSVRKDAVNVIAVLNAFEEEGWPQSILNPLSGGPDEKVASDTCATLNKGLRGLRFRSRDRGQNFCWEYVQNR